MKKILFMFAAALMMVACSNEDIATENVQYVNELKINFEGGDSRVAATPSAAGLKFAWENGDAVYVYEDGNTTATAKILEYDATSGTFKIQGGNNTNRLEAVKKYFAVTFSTWYFISKDENTGASVVESQLESGTGLKNIPLISNVFEATAENTMTTMHHLVGVVEIPVKARVADAKLQNLSLYTRRCNEAVTGYFAVSPVAPYTLIFEERTGYFENANQTSTDAPIDLSTSEATSIFIPAFPGTYNPIDFKYTLVGGTETLIETNKSLVVERGKITKLTEFILGVEE